MRDPFELTPREEAVMQGLCEGFTIEQVAENLTIRLENAKTYRNNAMAKLGAESERVAIILFKKNYSEPQK